MRTESKCPTCGNKQKDDEVWKCRNCGKTFCRRCGEGNYGDECPKCGSMECSKVAMIKP